MLAQIRAFMCRSASSQDPAAGEPRGPGGRRRIRAESPRQRCTRGGASAGCIAGARDQTAARRFRTSLLVDILLSLKSHSGWFWERPVRSPHRLRLRSHRRRRHYPERSSRSWTGTTKVRTGTTICPAIARRMTAASCPGRPGTTCLAGLRRFSPKASTRPRLVRLFQERKPAGQAPPALPEERATAPVLSAMPGAHRLFLEPDSRRAAVHWLVAGAGVGACLPGAMVAVASRRLPARRRFSRDRGTCW